MRSKGEVCSMDNVTVESDVFSKTIKSLLDCLPYPSMIVNQHHQVLATNNFAISSGIHDGDYCWQTVSHLGLMTEEMRQRVERGELQPEEVKLFCPYCKANESLEKSIPINIPELQLGDRWYSTWWIPIGRGLLLHYYVDITEQKNGCRKLQEINDSLERRVEERTAALVEANRALERTLSDHHQNMSALQLSEERLKANNEQMEKVLKTITGGMRVIDVDYNVLRVNEALAHLSHRPVHEHVGTKCYDSFPGEHCHQEHCPIRLIRAGKTVREVAVSMFGQGEEPTPCILNASPLQTEDGTVVGIVEEFRDQTERWQLESIAQSVETTNNISYIFSGIRHELGNPINSLKMALSVMKRKLETFSQDDINRYIDRMQQDIARVEFLLQSMRSFTLYESLKVLPISVADFFANVKTLLESEIENREITLGMELDPAGQMVHADPRALLQVILNVTGNAFDSLTGRPDPRIRIQTELQGNHLAIRVTDNGAGMSEKTMKNLFRPFYTTKLRGTGLGMVIVRKMVSNMGGTIEVQSVEGEGTTISILLEAANHGA